MKPVLKAQDYAQVIYKYPLDTKEMFTITMPRRAKLLSVGVQNGHPVLWAAVPLDAELYGSCSRVLRTYLTGQPVVFPGDMDYVGTYELIQGNQILIFHLFDVTWDGDK